MAAIYHFVNKFLCPVLLVGVLLLRLPGSVHAQEAPFLDLTQSNPGDSARLAQYLNEHATGSPSPLNLIQHSIRAAVHQGVPINILVLLLLFPLTASVIAIFRHLIGLRGFGVYTPAVLAVAFVSTGILRGLVLFSVIFLTATLGRSVINTLKIQYLPRAALLLWLVSLVIFLLLLLAPSLGLTNLFAVSIFPILMLILPSESFLEAQLSISFSKAVWLMVETLILAIVSSLFMSAVAVQQFVLVQPEITILGILLIDVLVGKYTGLRLTELFRFKSVVDPEE